ncbi:MAG: DUF3352 domain-containing protein [Planctomycetaceae bacterium]|jgi:hypothetical protein|nr:DUF3352 domain-containing protein [Planctomycetaceae bacterium]
MARFLLSLFCLLLIAVVSSASARTPAEKIFPDSTKGFLTIRNLKELGEQWSKTQIGTLMNDPIMEAFKKDLREQLNHRMEENFGLTLDGIEQLPSGEVAAGMIAIPNQIPGYVFTMDITDRRKETEDYLKRLTEKLIGVGVKRTTEQYKEQEIVVFAFPDRSQLTKPDASKPKITKPTAEPIDRSAFYLIKDNHLIVSDQQHLVKLIADRLGDSTGKSLADVEDYQVVLKRCLDDTPKDAEPLIRWYLEPLNYGESVRVLMKGPAAEKRKNKPSVFTVLKQQGFDAIRGIGGVVSLKAEDKETICRVFVYAKKPYQLAMRMLAFPDAVNFTPPTWMPSDLARCTILFVDPLAIFDNFGTLFDSLVMQGETGAWNDIIKGIEVDPYGPQINIREELLVNLGSRVLGMSKYSLPITPTSESVVVAVELKEGKDQNMMKALKKLFENDHEMQPIKYRSYILWQRVPAEEVIQPFSGPSGVPSLVNTASTTGTTKTVSVTTNNQETDPPPVFPDGAVTIAKGCLFVSTDGEYLKTILDRLDSEQESAIKEEPEYKAVDKVFASMGITDKPHFLQFFSRTDKTLQPIYELVRQGKMPQSQAILGKIINALFVPEEEEGVRPQGIDGKNLPEFDKVRQYFGTSGFYGVSEENGYFFKGFLLEKKNEEEIGPNRKAETKKEEPPIKPAEPQNETKNDLKNATEKEEPVAEKEAKKF